MKMKKEPYFNNIEPIGDLYLKETLVDFENTKVLTILEDSNKSEYLCYTVDTRRYEKWILFKSETEAIKNLKQNNTTIYDAIKSLEPLVQIRLYSDNTQTTKAIDRVRDIELPDKDIYLKDVA